jgi:UDP-glucose 4-epimerase
MNKKQTILVTGGCGYIGSHICVELLTSGYNAIVYDNLSNSTPDVIDRIRQIVASEKAHDVGSINFIQGDILDADHMDRIFADNKIDAVIHLAGLKAVGESVQKPLWYYENNVMGSINLLNSMQKHNVNKFIFSSSATVYGDPHALPITEDFPLSATNPYGETKLTIENILRASVAANKNLCVSILRYFNPIGAHSSGLIGEDPNGIPNNLAPYIAQVTTGQREHLNVFGNDYKTIDGTGVRDYIHVVDLALGHVAALEKINTAGAHVHNLGTSMGTSVLELLASFEKAHGHEIPYKIVARRPGDIDACYANCDKANTELGWRANLTIDNACVDTLRFINRKK